ncbi:MAG: glycoside hydrolase family 5 protein [Planctomycetaceae bacterium]|nr:glycoside hydrolase family 5 protein [Planctomycetaceae bacterium]
MKTNNYPLQAACIIVALTAMLFLPGVLFGGEKPANLPEDYHGFYVVDTKIHDGNGNVFVPVGVNTLFMYQDPGGVKTIPGIAKSSANCVRMFWQDDKYVPLSVLDGAIGQAVDNKLVVIVGLWEATGKWQNFDKCVDYWLRDDVKAVVKKHEKYFILNIANEAGDGTVSESEWESKYIDAVKKLRNAGYRVPLMIDPANWGRGEHYILNCGENVLASDPLRNIIFSWHPWDINQPTSRYTDAIKASLDKKLCMIVGEFSHLGAVYEGPLNWRPLVEECNKNNIGWLPWSWSMTNDKHNVVDNFDFQQKTEWGAQVLSEMDKVAVKAGIFDPKATKGQPPSRKQ